MAVSFSALAMAGTMSLTIWVVRGNAQSIHLTEAVTLGQDLIDDVRDRRYSQVVSGTDTNGMFLRSWNVTANSTTKRVDVTVQWPGIDGSTHRVALNTLVAEE